MGNTCTIELPDDPNIPIWRYLSLSKFLDILMRESLFFCRADRFKDTYEGFVNSALTEQISEEFTEFENAQQMQKDLIFQLSSLKEYSLVNCWNMSYPDSLDMWKNYCSEYEGVAIKSNIERLKSSIQGEDKDSFHIRPIKYRDIEKTEEYDANGINLFTFKKLEFSYENELRVILPFAHQNTISEEVIDEEGVELIPYEFGKYVSINFKNLVEEIYIAPLATSWFVELVETLVGLAYEIPILKSKISV